MIDGNSVNIRKGLAVTHIVAFMLMIALNSLAVFLPLNGKTTGELSDNYPNSFTPAGVTFSIWSVIYFFLLGFTIYQAIALFKSQHPSREQVLKISRPFIINCVANASWIVAWHYEQVFLSVLIMFVILGTLVSIHERLELALPSKPLTEKLWLDLPFSLYLGWISIATIANVTALLVHYNWNGAGTDPAVWTVVMIGVGTLLNVCMVRFKRNIAFGLVGIWALSGIILKRQIADGEDTNHVILSAQIGISLIVVFIMVHLIKIWRQSVDSRLNNETMAES